jgi:hypothetical protein
MNMIEGSMQAFDNGSTLGRITIYGGACSERSGPWPAYVCGKRWLDSALRNATEDSLIRAAMCEIYGDNLKKK